MGLTPKQKRNQPQTVEVPAGPTPSSADAMLEEITSALQTSKVAADSRMTAAKAWMDTPAGRPAPSGDRGPSHPSHPGHVDRVFGVSSHPAGDTLPPTPPRDRPAPVAMPQPAPVTTSGDRPPLGAGLVVITHDQPGPLAMGQQQDAGAVQYVTVDSGPRRESFLARFFSRLLGR